MLSPHPTKFSDHKQYSSGNIMFLVVEKQDYTCSYLNLTLFISFKKIWLESTRHIMSIRYVKFCQSVQKHPQGGCPSIKFGPLSRGLSTVSLTRW